MLQLLAVVYILEPGLRNTAVGGVQGGRVADSYISHEYSERRQKIDQSAERWLVRVPKLGSAQRQHM